METTMAKEVGRAEGLSQEALEAHSRAQLLPDRIEMHRRKRRRQHNRSGALGGLGGGAFGG